MLADKSNQPTSDFAALGAWKESGLCLSGVLEKEYWRASSHLSMILVKERAATAAEVRAEPSGDQWGWAGTRSNDSQLTAATLGAYLVHDLVHHLHDLGEQDNR